MSTQGRRSETPLQSDPHGSSEARGAPRPSPQRMMVRFLVEAPSGIVHVTAPTPNKFRVTAYCGRQPQTEWTRLWDQEIMVPVNLIGICRVCAARLKTKP